MPNRRQFLATLPLLAAACRTSRNSTAAPGILDTHTHFYDPSRPQGVPWPPKNDPVLYRTVLPAEFKSLVQPLGVTGTIVVEASPLVEDNDWILHLARTEPFIKGLVGHLKPAQPNFAADLARLSGNPLFRGIRVGLWNLPLEPQNTAYLRDLKLLADRDLSLDLLGGSDQIERITRLAAVLPTLRIVIDHCAGVRVTGSAPDPTWLSNMQKIGAHKNVFMKVSGLVEATGREKSAPSDVEFYRPTLDALWQTFGDDRVIFGSNWPVSNRFADYPTVLQIVRDYTSALSASAAEKYFYRNALAIYRPVML